MWSVVPEFKRLIIMENLSIILIKRVNCVSEYLPYTSTPYSICWYIDEVYDILIIGGSKKYFSLFSKHTNKQSSFHHKDIFTYKINCRL